MPAKTALNERVQITPLVLPATRDLLRDTCKEKRITQGELVEAAVLAYLAPSDDSLKLDVLLRDQQELQAMVERILAILLPFAAQEDAEVAPADTVPVASYAQLYGNSAPPLEQETVSQTTPSPPRRSRIHRLFFREAR